MATETVTSSILHVRHSDGTLVPHFPINTANEVYTDFNGRVKLSDYLTHVPRVIPVANDSVRFLLTINNVSINDLIIVQSTGKHYYVKDLDHLNSESGYTEVITTNVMEILTYTMDDITV